METLLSVVWANSSDYANIAESYHGGADRTTRNCALPLIMRA